MIRVMGVSKKFRIYTSPADRIKEKLFRRPYHHEYAALSDISFEVGPGETLGIIGENGAGKSTLLKILSGVLLPDTGSLEVLGKITGLLELGTGFNPELSGLENIYMNGTFLGISHAEIEAKKDTIIDFAELGEFIHQPIKTYSSGMMMRLGFAIAIHADPKCFLVDEALSVGDAYFQQKCMWKIQEFKERGGSIIFVSHDMNAVKVLCDKVIFLEYGRIINCDIPKIVVDLYLNTILQKSHLGENPLQLLEDTTKVITSKISGVSTQEAKLISFKVLNESDEEVTHIISENKIKIKCEIIAYRDIEEPHFGLHIRNHLGLSIFDTNTYCMHIKTEKIKSYQIVTVIWEIFIPVFPGNYSFSVGFANKGYDSGLFAENIFLFHNVFILNVLKNDESIIYSGIFNLTPKITIY